MSTEAYQRTVWVQGDCSIIVYCGNPVDGSVATLDYLGDTLPLYSPLPLSLPPENPNGVLPLLDDPCGGYFNPGVTLSATGTFLRKAVTGRGRRKIIPANFNLDDVTLIVPAMFVRKNVEYDLNHLFVPQQILLVAVKFINPIYSGLSPNENDIFLLRWAVAQEFSLSGEQTEQVGVVTASAKFIAESLS